MPTISGSSELIIRMATPAIREAAHDAVDFDLGADIDAARRLVEDQHLAAVRAQRAKMHLLLVAARQVADRRGRAAAGDR